jgi:hypothetical protein
MDLSDRLDDKNIDQLSPDRSERSIPTGDLPTGRGRLVPEHDNSPFEVPAFEMEMLLT